MTRNETTYKLVSSCFKEYLSPFFRKTDSLLIRYRPLRCIDKSNTNDLLSCNLLTVRMVECVCLGERFCRCKIVIGFHFPKREESREEGRVPTAHAAPAHSECGPLACLDGFTFRQVLDRPAYLCSIRCLNNNLECDSAFQNEKKCK